MAEDKQKEIPPSDLFSAWASMVPLWSSLVLHSFFEGQRAMLSASEAVLTHTRWPGVTDEQARDLAKHAQQMHIDWMEATAALEHRFDESARLYRDRVAGWQSELVLAFGKRLLALQSDLLRGYRQTVEGVLNSVDAKLSK